MGYLCTGIFIMRFSDIIEGLISLPQWCVFVPPALLLVVWIPLALCGKRGMYRYFALVCLTAEGILLCRDESELLVLFTAALALVLYPAVRGRKREKRNKREEALYTKFREEREEPFPESKTPPKVCCFEQPHGETAEERGIKLSHVISLIEKLKREKLTAADRLEVEMLSRRVEGANVRPLTDEGADALSDDLSAVLRLMAKYS